MATYGGGDRPWQPSGEPVEKPYQLIPFFGHEPSRSAPQGHGTLAQGGQRATLAGVIDFTLTTLTPLHVGLGIVGVVRSRHEEEFAALPVVARRYTSTPEGVEVLKVPRLPGSSLKGALRSLAEAISPSCVAVVSNDLRRQLDHKYPFRRCSDVDRLCPSCRLFGNTQYASHVSVSDLLFSPKDLRRHESPLLWKPGRGSGLRRRYTDRGQPAGRKVYYHRAPVGGPDLRVVIRQAASVEGRITFAGVQPADLGLLLAAMGVDPDHPFPVKVGGGKPVGLGSVSIQARSVVPLEGAAAADRLRQTGRLGVSLRSSVSVEGELAGEELKAWLRRQIQAAREAGVLQWEAYQRLQMILDRDGLKKPAPDQAY